MHKASSALALKRWGHPLPEAARREKTSGNRVRGVLTLPFHGDVDTNGLAWFYNGSNNAINSNWVPYERPEIVEQMLPGWVHEALEAHERTNEMQNLVVDTLEALKD
ncbi:hypothetical protein H257_17722 [Aphanomyces astaci]|uniref:Uncharacterized protein n=1 Tax=Aphanomyces astaci TaxID=112090 RepID=W4FFW0_APHAT|nr:hypothetical protein H257_17722 [Aphanomyces astaci]ETV65613.1 hypothetical protein H257_17722 [Aphanomyces astaci]|eukprot:XP_009844910.1 hypothetical protein H257_17722 [Aphanomyces astaci]